MPVCKQAQKMASKSFCTLRFPSKRLSRLAGACNGPFGRLRATRSTLQRNGTCAIMVRQIISPLPLCKSPSLSQISPSCDNDASMLPFFVCCCACVFRVVRPSYAPLKGRRRMLNFPSLNSFFGSNERPAPRLLVLLAKHREV